jgi:hypothetical protein
MRYIPPNAQNLALAPDHGAKQLEYALLRLKGASGKTPIISYTSCDGWARVSISYASKQSHGGV